MIDVSIVIVCMNNLKKLYPCLSGIKKYTTSVTYETLVVAYLFSKENLERVKRDFSWVTFIESNEIRGFSENNNLALRRAKGKYCFVVNDDTEMKMDVLGGLVSDFKKLNNNVAIVSPKLIYWDGSTQFCGRPPFMAKEYIKTLFHLWDEKKNGGIYINGKGLFKTYNIVGAAFLVRTDIIKSIGLFDEYYFFCPEDIALSTLLNKKGWECYVDENLSIYHYEGGSGKNNISKVKLATMPAGDKGSMKFLANGNIYVYYMLCTLTFIFAILKFVVFLSKSKSRGDGNFIMAHANLNTARTIFSKLTPKEIFIKYFQ